ncbi:hypothetical protein CDL12_04716 [Handroanthus impetiginosus]|uniref:Bifunctional inhibitor/plant lipid transfer protein/seed storage helical domain-containing protein n=1 Tax=Handroanthus impetiginosus TaxID=429701 RepID=A0A2G9HYL2_9LAMI|nr:hypothetical protein CDL12_04716 [Handroanthus impetiginosus]
MASQFLILILSISAAVSILSPVVSGQTINAPCTPSMITTFTPCMNFVTNNSVNGTTPPADCCNSLKSLMSNGKDCLCLIFTGSAGPFRIPINRTLAISLPRSCNMPVVPLQCKGPDPANGPSISPNAAPSPRTSPSAPAPPEPLSPRGDAAPTPPAPTTNGGPPSGTTGSRAGATPSAARPSYSVSPLHIMAVLGAIALKYY